MPLVPVESRHSLLAQSVSLKIGAYDDKAVFDRPDSLPDCRLQNWAGRRKFMVPESLDQLMNTQGVALRPQGQYLASLRIIC